MAKMEMKIRELESELATTQSRTGEAAKALQRGERKAKELAFAQGEDKKNQDKMSDLAAKLQGKIKTYKQQIEEAEEIAALNLAKFRKAQQDLEETEERAKLAMVLVSKIIDGNQHKLIKIRKFSNDGKYRMEDWQESRAQQLPSNRNLQTGCRQRAERGEIQDHKGA